MPVCFSHRGIMQLDYYKSFSKAQRATLSQDSVKGVGLFETGVIMIMRRGQICFTLIGDPLLLNKLRTKLPVKPTRPPLNETLWFAYRQEYKGDDVVLGCCLTSSAKQETSSRCTTDPNLSCTSFPCTPNPAAPDAAFLCSFSPPLGANQTLSQSRMGGSSSHDSASKVSRFLSFNIVF